jgi:hypothetical protein
MRTNGVDAAVADAQGWQERTTPELFKFEKEGDSVIGFLEKCFRELAEGKQVPTYLIRTDTGERLKVRATYDLLQKITSEDVGMRVRIVYDGEQETAQSAAGTGSSMKKFKVWLKAGPPRRPPSDPTQITDEDIPF